MLKRKKKNTQAEWLDAYCKIREYMETPQGVHDAEVLIEIALERILPLGASHCVYAWSGGKDAIALQVICEEAGIHNCGLGTIGERWEYPTFSIGGNMLGREVAQRLQRLVEALRALRGDAEHQIGADILKACLAKLRKRATKIRKIMPSAKAPALVFVHALESDAHAVKACAAKRRKAFGAPRGGVALQRDLRIGGKRILRAHRAEQGDELFGG